MRVGLSRFAGANARPAALQRYGSLVHVTAAVVLSQQVASEIVGKVPPHRVDVVGAVLGRGRRVSMRASCVTGARLPTWSDGRSPICPCTPYGQHWWLSFSRPCSATVEAPHGTAPADSPD